MKNSAAARLTSQPTARYDKLALYLTQDGNTRWQRSGWCTELKYLELNTNFSDTFTFVFNLLILNSNYLTHNISTMPLIPVNRSINTSSRFKYITRLFWKLFILGTLPSVIVLSIAINKSRTTQTSPTLGPTKAGCILPWLLICSHAKLSAGQCNPGWQWTLSWTHCWWLYGGVIPKNRCWFTLIRAVSTQAMSGSSFWNHMACRAAWTVAVTVTIMQLPKVFSSCWSVNG